MISIPRKSSLIVSPLYLHRQLIKRVNNVVDHRDGHIVVDYDNSDANRANNWSGRNWTGARGLVFHVARVCDAFGNTAWRVVPRVTSLRPCRIRDEELSRFDKFRTSREFGRRFFYTFNVSHSRLRSVQITAARSIARDYYITSHASTEVTRFE